MFLTEFDEFSPNPGFELCKDFYFVFIDKAYCFFPSSLIISFMEFKLEVWFDG